MKTILCFGDSNTWGASPVPNGGRYDMTVRWGSVLRQTLGADYWVVEEGLGGRTTVWDDPVEGDHKNGKRYLPACLESHQPIDLVAIMLGTNDLKSRFGLSAADIAYGAGTLLDIVLRSASGPNWTAPKALLICPPPVAKLTGFADMFTGATEKSRQMATYYQQQADVRGCAFLNAGEVIHSSDLDGIHLDASEQQKLGIAAAAKVRQILG